MYYPGGTIKTFEINNNALAKDLLLKIWTKYEEELAQDTKSTEVKETLKFGTVSSRL